ncbi:PH domain-containing protein [Microbacterium sp. 18062]|uniref:PH domain-containing protein n=1 Tax=Microbacterium sp. 18062 TaxID=2681410 RepID=UPI001356BA6D|nr:PH domain-containing protein [Microbacterium sp. 18062]
MNESLRENGAPGRHAASPADEGWHRLSSRVIWVDLAVSALSVLPGALAILVFGVEPDAGMMWPLIGIAAFGVVGGIGDIVRWAFTRYRVTPTEIEGRSGVLVRRRRSVRRDRIRSVDTHARLRHRLAGLRVVTIGAGQQTGSGEAALHLDALSVADAADLRRELLADRPQQETTAGDQIGVDPALETPEQVRVLATFRPWWVVYNMFSVWAYLLAAGVLWGLAWLLSTFGIDLLELASSVIDGDELGWAGIAVLALVGGGLFGAVGMGIAFLAGHWRFELTRVRTGGKSYLRTRRGLFSTHEVSRDESRMRGLTIMEPLLWRWMGMADTHVITTGLGLWDATQPTAILPRGPIGVARPVSAEVLGEPCPIDAELARHPSAALRRRLWWATLISAVPAAVLAVPAATGAVAPWTLWIAPAVWPIALLGGRIAYRALGHALSGDYLVVRSGLLTRSTSALRRDAVSTIAVRQSILQRRLGLCTVSAMTAAGWYDYEASDVAADTSVALAARAAPGVIDEFTAAGGGR